MREIIDQPSKKPKPGARGAGPGADQIEAMIRHDKVLELLALEYSTETIIEVLKKQFAVDDAGARRAIAKVRAEQVDDAAAFLRKHPIDIKAAQLVTAKAIARASMRDKKYSAANQALRTQIVLTGTAAPIRVELTAEALIERRAKQIAMLVETNSPAQIEALIAEGEAVEE